MTFGLLCMAACNAAILVGSRALLRRVETGRREIDALLFLLIRLCLISIVLIVAGLGGTLSPLPLGAAGGVALAALLAAGAHRGGPREGRVELGPIVAVFGAAVLVRLLLQVWFFAPHMGDPLTYHLPKLAEWIRAGGFTREMGLHPHVTFPAGFELLELWWTVFLRHDVLIEAAGVEFLALGYAATRALAITAGLGGRAASLAGLCYVLTPGPYLNALSCLNDSAVASLAVATFALVAARAPDPLVALAVGLGLGVKPTYAFLLPGVLALRVLVRREPAPASRSGSLAFTLGALALGVGAFWYARNWAWFGNPVHPVGRGGYDHPVPAQFGASLGSLAQNLGVLLNTCVYDHMGAYSADVHGIAGWGAVPFACGIVGWLALARESLPLRRLSLGFAISAVSAMCLVKLDPWCMRFLFFFPALLCVAAAALAETAGRAKGVVVAALAYQFLATFLPYDLPPRDAAALASQGWRERSAAEIVRVRVPDEIRRVGCFGAFSGREYTLYRPDYSRQVVHLRSRSVETLLRDMEREDVELLYAAPLSEGERAILEEALRAGRLTRVREFLYLRTPGPGP